MWNAGFLCSASTAFHRWSVVRCSLFGHFPSVFKRDRNSFSGLVQVCHCPRRFACRLFAEVFSLLHANTCPRKNNHAYRSAQIWTHAKKSCFIISLKSWIMTIVLQLNIRVAAPAPKNPRTLLWHSGLKDVYIWTYLSEFVCNIHTRTRLLALRGRSWPVGLDLKASVWAVSLTELHQ